MLLLGLLVGFTSGSVAGVSTDTLAPPLAVGVPTAAPTERAAETARPVECEADWDAHAPQGLLRPSVDSFAPSGAADDFANWGGEFIDDGARMVDQGLGVPFRSDTSHIFRNAPGHLAQDTAANRALITSAVQPGNLVDTVTVGGQTIRTYQRLLPDGTQVWAEVRNGVEITNGGLNLVPR